MKRVASHQLSLVVLGLMLWVAAAFAQSDSICSFDWNQSTECALHLGDCFDSTTYAGKTIIVPSNVTHIGKTGLQLCVNDVNVGNPADIVYAVDMTWSMFQNVGSGDYKFARAAAVKAGIQYQIDSAQASSFGYIGFVDSIVTKTTFPGKYPYWLYVGATPLNPVPVGYTQSTVGGGWKVVKDDPDPALSGNHLFDLMRISADVPAARSTLTTIYSRLNHDQHLALAGERPSTFTNFYVPLSKARQMLFSKDSTHDKIIIFIADGGDTKDQEKRAALIDSLKNNDVRVFTVLLGSANATQIDVLKKMASLTGGEYHQVSNPDSLASVLGSIVKKVISFQFESITVKANGTTVNAGADPVEVSDGKFQLVLNNILPLKPGLNDISFDARFRSSDPATQGKAIKFDFKINVSGSANPNCYTCRPRSKLEVFDINGSRLDSLTWQTDSVVVRLTYYGSQALSSAHAFLATTDNGDMERFNNPPLKSSASPWVYEQRIPFRQLLTTTPSANNRIEAVGIDDTVRISWNHPIDSLDRSNVVLPVIAPPNRVMVYNAPGDPALSTVKPYAVPPAHDTIIAGSVVHLYAKALSNQQWLAPYEQQTALKNSFSWKLSDGTVGTLNKTTGNYVQYTPKTARSTVDITVTLNAGQGVIDTTIRFYIKAGPAAKIVIEDNYLGGKPITNLSIGPTATIATPASYAVYRDKDDNYVGPVTTAQWVSLNTLIVTAASGNQAQGQGIVSRADSADTVSVFATDEIFYDTAKVTVSLYTYTAIKIAQGPSINDTISRLDLTTDSDTTRLYAFGKRSDNGVWELLNGAGWGSSGVSLAPGAPQGSAQWAFVPKSQGNGAISASFSSGETQLSALIAVKIDHGPPASMALYTAEGDPKTVTAFDGDTAIRAGDNLLIVAKLFNNLGQWIAQGESVDSLRQRISWQVLDGPASARLTDASGHKSVFSAEIAYRSYTVRATYVHAGKELVQELDIEVGPGDTVKLVIEESVDWSNYKNTANPVDTLRITSNSQSDNGYAVFRDNFNNFIAFATQAGWTSADETVVTAASGEVLYGEGIATREPNVESGITTVTATQAGFSDNVPVRVLPFYYDYLKILDRTAQGYVAIDTLTLNTNQTDTLFSVGRRSNDASIWDTIAVTWQSSASLHSTIAASLTGKSYQLDPTAPATGFLRITLGNDEVSRPDTVQLVITAGPADTVKVERIPPVDSLIAGLPIKIDLVLENQDGPMPGDSCYRAVFSDLLAGGPAAFPPKVIDPESGETVALGEGVQLCFTNGRSSIEVILYNAPADKSPHVIKAVLDNRPELTTQTPPFVLKPGPLNRLDIVKRQGGSYVSAEQIRLAAPGFPVELYTQGYDKYENLIGLVASDWVTAGTIPAESKDSTSRLFYDGTRISDAGTGFIIASAPHNGAINDSVSVLVTGPDAVLLKALTRDTSGNGYLDMVELHFSDTVNATAASLLAQTGIKEHGASRSFVNKSIIGANGTMLDSVFYLSIEEQAQGNPQTAMMLDVRVANALGVTDGAIESLDGAGPVLWRVTKRQNDARSLSDDEVTVEFSEPVQTTNGGVIDLGMAPGSFLQVWEKSAGQFVERTAFLEGIPGLITPKVSTNEFGGTVIVFRMAYENQEAGVEKQRDLMSRNYLRLDSLALLIVDDAQNPPRLDNRRVQVVVIGDPSDPVVYPNPTRPTFRRVPPGRTIWGHQPGAVDWVALDRSGIVVTYTIPLPLQPDGTSGPGPNKVEQFIKIYDMVGNLVDEGSVRDLVQQYMDAEHISEVPSSSITPGFYWNGSNKLGMAVAPGAYRIFVYLNYTSPNQKDIKKAITVGIGY